MVCDIFDGPWFIHRFSNVYIDIELKMVTNDIGLRVLHVKPRLHYTN